MTNKCYPSAPAFAQEHLTNRSPAMLILASTLRPRRLLDETGFPLHRGADRPSRRTTPEHPVLDQWHARFEPDSAIDCENLSHILLSPDKRDVVRNHNRVST
jgi:hypothetical protein